MTKESVPRRDFRPSGREKPSAVIGVGKRGNAREHVVPDVPLRRVFLRPLHRLPHTVSVL